MQHDAIGIAVGKVIGWLSMVCGPVVGTLLAAASDSPWEAGGWMAGGSMGFVAGYLLVYYLPRRDEAHDETVKHISSEHRAACEAIARSHADGNQAICESVAGLRDDFKGMRTDSQRLMEMLARQHIEHQETREKQP